MALGTVSGTHRGARPILPKALELFVALVVRLAMLVGASDERTGLSAASGVEVAGGSSE